MGGSLTGLGRMCDRRGLCTVLRVVALALIPVVHAEGQGSSSLLTRRSGLEVETVTLEEGLRELRRSAGVSVAFSPDLLPSSARVTCWCAELSVGAALDRILSDTGLRYVAGRSQILIARRDRDEGGDAARGSIVGRIVDQLSGAPVVGARIRLMGDGRLVLSGSDGRFVIPGVRPGSYVVEVSALGFRNPPPTPLEVERTAMARVEMALVRAPIPRGFRWEF